MKKKNIAYRIRIVAIIALAVIMTASACSLMFYGLAGVPTKKVVPRASYSYVSEIAYTPILKMGALYNAGSIEFGEHYITNYVDKLNVNCKYDFAGYNASDINGSYSIKVTMQAINNKLVVWQKEYPFVNEQKFTGNKAEKAIVMDLLEYRNLIDGLEKETGIKCDVTMKISYGVNLSAVIGGKTVNETSESTLQFPMKELLMQFSGEPVKKLEKTIDETITTETKMSKALLIANIAILALVIASLAYILFFTVGQRSDPAQRQLKKIFKQYGSRIVELKPNTILRADNLIVVSNFRDLLLAADELKRPILKIGEEDYRLISFYVMDEERQYVYHAKSLADKLSEEVLSLHI